MKFIKSRYRTTMTNDHLEALLQLALSNYTSDYVKLANSFPFQVSSVIYKVLYIEQGKNENMFITIILFFFLLLFGIYFFNSMWMNLIIQIKFTQINNDDDVSCVFGEKLLTNYPVRYFLKRKSWF